MTPIRAIAVSRLNPTRDVDLLKGVLPNRNKGVITGRIAETNLLTAGLTNDSE
jgi:hypothetical protein